MIKKSLESVYPPFYQARIMPTQEQDQQGGWARQNQTGLFSHE
jgi:hypothetical protein